MNAPLISRAEAKAPCHVFEIDVDVWDALSSEEIVATVEAMHEFGIYQLPYGDGELILRLRHHDDHDPSGYHQVTEVRGLRNGEEFCENVIQYPKQAKGNAGLRYYRSLVQKREMAGDIFCRWLDPHYKMVDIGISLEGKRVAHRYRVFCVAGEVNSQKYFRDGLIVLLASKGLIKETKEKKQAKLGVGKGNHRYVTTIKLSQNLESHESARSGAAVRPHLRRGHIRSQHYGQGNQLVKKIWIEPCFVNADENFVSTRKAYRVIQ